MTSKSVESGLTPKQKTFCEEYLIDLNGSQAAIRAGYSESSAKEIASENLTKPNIQEALKYQIDKRSKRTEITADRILGALDVIARNIEGEQTRDRIRALELLGKYLAMFTEKHIIEVKEPLPTAKEVLASLAKLDEELKEVLH